MTRVLDVAAGPGSAPLARHACLLDVMLRALVPAVLLAVLPPAVAQGRTEPTAPRVHRPYDRYRGTTGAKRKLDLYISGRTIDLAAFDIGCRGAAGRTSLNAIAMHRTPRGWRFSTTMYGSITFADGRPDENARFVMTGRFSTSAKVVKGTLRVKGETCGDTGAVAWSAFPYRT
jgi:hypothetical protein